MNKIVWALFLLASINESIAAKDVPGIVTFSKSGTYDYYLGHRRLKDLITKKLDFIAQQYGKQELDCETMIHIVRFMRHNHYKFYEEIKLPGRNYYLPIEAKSDFCRLISREVDKIKQQVKSSKKNPIITSEACSDDESEDDNVFSIEIEEDSTDQQFTDADVLFGRGPAIVSHLGNKKFHTLVNRRRKEYQQSKDAEFKKKIAQEIVKTIWAGGGNFLRLEDDNWRIVTPTRAVEKTSQALREKK